MMLTMPEILNRRVWAGLALVGALSACDTTGVRDGAVLVDPVIEDPIVVEEAPVALESPAESAVTAKRVPSRSPRAPRRGVLTAGDIDDALNLAAFASYQAGAAKRLKLPRTNLSKPVLARITTFDGKPAPGVRVTLRKPGAADAFYTGYSGVDGLVSVFPAAYGHGRPGAVELRAFPEGQGEAVTQKIATNGTRANVSIADAEGWKPDFLDLAFVVDTTGSMGDELAWLTKELKSIVRQARRAAPGVDIRYGLVVYRDRGDQYVVRNYGFTKSQGQMQKWLRAQNAGGGGDYPEAAAEALMAGANLNWRRGKGERLMFHIADAPPHDRDAKTYLKAARRAAAKDVQIFGLGASGVGAESEFLMRQASVLSNGRYLFLTDDSGVGYGHAEPTISCYQVSRLNDLMVRVLKSELSGTRVEAKPGSVIRQVGSYRRGVCLN
ncbi:vWA domain-containing protein [uncultured Litoreibacter sp.]|uniref:vWA domain-containing protein n=1 Tax=uncultured Litoreibacter sp. TaxID=1392394 RepID=UPI0026146F57|nr:vWA domain-containing protein [uncultured Litoreibacter sp.]